jgi:hypothetical protein
MNRRGIAKGRLIELDERLPYADGQPLNVTVEPLNAEACLGTPAALLEALRRGPRVEPATLDDLDQVIERGRRPAGNSGVFDGAG